MHFKNQSNVTKIVLCANTQNLNSDLNKISNKYPLQALHEEKGIRHFPFPTAVQVPKEWK